MNALRTLLFSACLLMVLDTRGQWTTQTIALRPGWNAVFLEVQPEPSDCDVALVGLPIESVWAYNRKHSSVQFIQDPTTLVPGNPDWLTWLPLNQPATGASTLFELEGRRAYLIKLANNAANVNWTVKGRPILKPIEWLQDSLNLVGFAIAAGNGPSFQNFFSGSPAHAGQAIYQLNAQGQWIKVAQPNSTFVRSGEAYWIHCAAPSNYSGPLKVDAGQRAGLDYGLAVSELTLRIRNTSPQPRSFAVTKLNSAPPPAVGQAPLAGAVPLEYFKMNLAVNEYVWSPLPSTLEKLDVPPGETWELRLAVRRNQMAPSNDPTAQYQSLLEVSDDSGARWLVPVAAYGLQGDPAAPLGAGPLALTGPVHPRAGLWVGTATLNKVSQPAHPTTPGATQPADSQAQFRLLIHVTQQGAARLLQKVIAMWKNGTTKPDPGNPGKLMIDEPGRYVLLTDESQLSNFSGAALRDGQPVGRRISSAAFAFKNPIPMSGAGDFGTNILSCAVSLDFNDPLNPFKHSFHPDHNNLDERYAQALPEGAESFTVQRFIQLEFQSNDPDGYQIPGWGDTQLGGRYRETISGIHKSPIVVEGKFRLQQASRVVGLNDQN